MTPATITDINN